MTAFGALPADASVVAQPVEATLDPGLDQIIAERQRHGGDQHEQRHQAQSAKSAAMNDTTAK